MSAVDNATMCLCAHNGENLKLPHSCLLLSPIPTQEIITSFGTPALTMAGSSFSVARCMIRTSPRRLPRQEMTMWQPSSSVLR